MAWKTLYCTLRKSTVDADVFCYRLYLAERFTSRRHCRTILLGNRNTRGQMESYWGVSCLTWNQSHGPLSSMCFKLTKSALDITILADKQRTLQRQYTAIWYRGTTDIPLSIHLPFIGFILTNVPLPPDILTVLQGKLLSGATADASTDDAFSCLLHVWIASIAVSKS
jgi:hypothetical protein